MTRIVVIGLGYVGLPLAVALARKFDVIGFDIHVHRIAELRQFQDRTGEVATPELKESSLRVTSDPSDCAGADVYIVTVPTPVDARKRPDLGAVLSATEMLAGLLDPARRPTVIYESTVYPGVTEEICGPRIEATSGLKRGPDFRLAYSPERINPGDRVHSVDKITKVIAGEDAEVLEQLSTIYGAITTGGVFRPLRSKLRKLPRPSRMPSGTSTSPSSTKSRRSSQRLGSRSRMCLRPPGPNGISSTSSPGWSGATASALILSISAILPSRSGMIRKSFSLDAKRMTKCRPGSPIPFIVFVVPPGLPWSWD
jgi:hypothetical protein